MEMELKNIIDEQLEVKQQIVTYKYLTEKLNVHPNKAKQMLNTYVGLLEDDTKYSITVVIGGRLKENDEFCMVMAYGDHLETMRRRYKEIDFEHIYSIQPIKRFDDINNALYLIDNSLNNYSNLPSSIKKNEKQCVSIPKQNVEIEMETDLLSTKESSLTSNSNVLNHSNETNNTKLDKTQKKKTGTDIFAKKNKNNVTKTEETKTEKKEAETKALPKKTNTDFFTQFKKSNGSDSAKTVPNKEVLKENIIENDIKIDEEPPKKTVEHSVVEQTKKKPTKKKANGNKVKNNQKAKRKRIQTFDSSDEEVDSEEEDKKRSVNVLDVEEDDNDLVQPTPPRPTVRENRKKEKQTTTSTFLDDDGFMCTTKEVQIIETVLEPSLEIEDSNVENSKSKELNYEPVNKKMKFSEVDTAVQVDKKKAKSKQSKSASNQGMKQSSLNSFFLKQNK